MVIQPRNSGWIEVVCGPMFSGKTEELIRRLRRAELAKQKVEVFKPEIDQRYSATDVVSHSSQRVGARTVTMASSILEQLGPDTQVIGIDEAQFFDDRIVDVAERLANAGRRVVVAGLDTDFKAMPFEPMPALIAIADFVTKLSAVCMQCGDPATRTQRLVGGGSDRVEVAGHDRYEARCRKCHEPNPS
ncbi:MAG: thymidine kinase [Myxococcota bacterium]